MDIYLIAGQSNALGISPVKDLPESFSAADVLIYQASNVHVPHERAIVPVQPGLGADGQKFGLELGIARAFAGKKVGLIKYASDGTSLYDRWSLGGEDFIGLKQTFEDGIAAFAERGLKPRVRGMLWMQGENDASFAEQAAVYKKKLKEFISAVRTFADVPFVMGETHPCNPRLPYSAEVNEAKRSAASEMSEVYFVPTDDLVELIDGYHYTAKNMLELGERMAKILIENGGL